MIFNVIAKSDTADDADPNTTPPAAARIVTLDEFADTHRTKPVTAIALRVRVLIAAGTLAATGASDLIVWAKDQGTTAAPWVKLGSVTGLANDTLGDVTIPSTPGSLQVFVQAKNVAGTNKDHVQIGVAGGGAP